MLTPQKPRWLHAVEVQNSAVECPTGPKHQYRNHVRTITPRIMSGWIVAHIGDPSAGVNMAHVLQILCHGNATQLLAHFQL